MTTTTAALVSTATHPSVTWIRPWYPGGADVIATGPGPMVMAGHLFADCELLLDVNPDPQEGSGWLDPHSPGVCEDCLLRHDPKLHAEVFGDEDDK